MAHTQARRLKPGARRSVVGDAQPRWQAAEKSREGCGRIITQWLVFLPLAPVVLDSYPGSTIEQLSESGETDEPLEPQFSSLKWRTITIPSSLSYNEMKWHNLCYVFSLVPVIPSETGTELL